LYNMADVAMMSPNGLHNPHVQQDSTDSPLPLSVKRKRVDGSEEPTHANGLDSTQHKPSLQETQQLIKDFIEVMKR
jgi:hypothetical protein